MVKLFMRSQRCLFTTCLAVRSRTKLSILISTIMLAAVIRGGAIRSLRGQLAPNPKAISKKKKSKKTKNLPFHHLFYIFCPTKKKKKKKKTNTDQTQWTHQFGRRHSMPQNNATECLLQIRIQLMVPLG
jgi:hypothetical protein